MIDVSKIGKTPNGIVRVLEASGFRFVGAGSYSVVYASPDNTYAVKVNTSADSAWNGYIDAIVSGKISGDHFPIIHQVHKLEKHLSVVSMELLARYDAEVSIRVLSGIANSIDDSKLDSDLLDLGNKKIAWAMIDALKAAKSADPKSRMDIHVGNVLMRGSTIVLSDPVYGH